MTEAKDLREHFPDFRCADVLRAHIAKTMDFYHPNCIDPSGGFYHYFKDDGAVYDRLAVGCVVLGPSARTLPFGEAGADDLGSLDGNGGFTDVTALVGDEILGRGLSERGRRA